MAASKTPSLTLVTGATGALGSAVLERLLREPQTGAGPDLIALTLDKPGMSHPRNRWEVCNVADRAQVAGLWERLRTENRVPQAVIHCAGGFRYASVAETTDADWDFLIGTNLASSFYLSRQAMRDFEKAAFGRMVFISARSSLAPTAGVGAYTASKAGINALVGALAQEAKGRDITFNALLPTIIDTPANRKDMPGADASAWVTTAELAELAVSLTRPWGRPFQGALIPVSGRI